MATFHAKGKAKLIVPFDDFGISHVTKKCLCAMFSFHPRTIHVPRIMHMMPTTMLLDLFIKFWSLMTSIWSGSQIPEDSRSLNKFF
jgi:hypothetical protein